MPAPPACSVNIARMVAATENEAGALEDLAGSVWGTTEVPQLLKRADKLLRYAEALVKSALCTGRDSAPRSPVGSTATRRGSCAPSRSACRALPHGPRRRARAGQ